MSAPACILLDRTITFRDHPQDLEEVDSHGAAGTTTETPSEPPSVEAIGAAVPKYLRTLKPELRFVDPPGVSSLTVVGLCSSDLLPQFGCHAPSGFVAAADKNLVVLYAGSNHPASSDEGYYLLLNAESSSLSMIPGVRRTPYYNCAGYGTVIAAREHGAFLLAELLFSFRRPPAPATGMLCLWQGCEWVYKVGQLPAQVCYPWRIHASFSVQGKRNFFCWVNLVHGLLLHCCQEGEEVDSSSSLLSGMSFVPLPSNCSISEKYPGARLNPQDFRTAGSVDGTIKFLTMDGFVGGGPISIVTYTLHLHPDGHVWTKDTILPLDHLWADETYISTGASPRIKPLFPMLSTQEHDIVYLVVPGAWKVQLLLSVDTRTKKVISATKQNFPRTLFSSRYLLPFSAYQWGLKNQQQLCCLARCHLYDPVQQRQINKVGSGIASNSYTGQKTLRAVEAIGMELVGKKAKFELPPQQNRECCEV